MNKRAIAILGAIFLLIVLALGLLIYLRSRKTDTAANNNQQNTQTNQEVVIPDNTPTNTNTNTNTDTSSTGKAEKLSDDSVVSPTLYYNGQGISYFNNQGQLFTMDLQISGSRAFLSNKRELTIPLKPGMSNIMWAPSGQSFIAEFQSGNTRTWSFYDSSKGAYADLPTQVQSLAWLPSNAKILFVWKDAAGKAFLNSANPDTSGYAQLTDLYEADNEVVVSPDSKSVLFYRFANSGSQNAINFVSPDGKVFKAVVKDGFNFGVKWAPDSNKFLFAKRDSATQKYTLWVGDLTTGEVKSLAADTTVEKATWSRDSQTVYAAVPNTGNAGQGLTQDTLVKISVVIGQQQKYDFGIAADARNLFLDSTEQNVFFKNFQDQALYYLNLSAPGTSTAQ